MKIDKITKYRTTDGVEHTTREMAEYHIVNRRLVEDLVQVMEISPDGAQDILNVLSGRPKIVREWLDKADAMERSAR